MTSVGRMALCALLLSVAVPALGQWYPTMVQVHEPALSEDSRQRSVRYTALTRATEPWRVCVSIPHVKDSFWNAVSFGLAAEAARLDIAMRLLVAGSYARLDRQRQQLSRCLADGVDGLVVASISGTGLLDIVERARDAEIPVIDLVNGMDTSGLSGRSMSSYFDAARLMGEYLVGRHTASEAVLRIAWFPGPKDAQWSREADRGLRASIDGSSVRIVATQFGNTSHQSQAAMLGQLLDNGPEFDVFIGSSGGAVAAARVLRDRGLADRVRVLAFNYGPAVHRDIQRGTIEAAVEDQPVVTARLAVDLAVRAIEGRVQHADVGPQLRIVDRDNIGVLNLGASLAPTGFQPVYRYGWSSGSDG